MSAYQRPNRIPELKIKVRSLAAEIAMIHQAERRHRGVARLAGARARTFERDPYLGSNRVLRLLGAEPIADGPVDVADVEETRFQGCTWGPIRPFDARAKDLQETAAYHGDARRSLREHRLELRQEVRAAMLALAFLRGRAYASVEPTARSLPPLVRVTRIAQKFGSSVDLAGIHAWAGSPMLPLPAAPPAPQAVAK